MLYQRMKENSDEINSLTVYIREETITVYGNSVRKIF